MTAAIRWFSGAASDSTGVEKASPSRWLMMAMPWSPSVPDTKTLSPGWQAAPERFTPGATSPTPAVLMYTPSAPPRSTTLVSPVMMATPASRAVAAMVRQISRSLSMG